MNLSININVQVVPTDADLAATTGEVEESADKAAANNVPKIHVEPCSPSEQKAVLKGFCVPEKTNEMTFEANYSWTMKPQKNAAPLNACFEHPSSKVQNFEFALGDSKLGSQKQPVVDVFGTHCEKKWSTFKQQRLSPF